jgi:hypothetical protein
LHEGGEKTKEKSKIIILLMVLSLFFTPTATLAALTERPLKIKFYFVELGSCLITRGDVNNPLWNDTGTGSLVVTGKADGEYYEQPVGMPPVGVLKGYMMKNLAVGGGLLLQWTEADNSKRWVAVTFYSTATSIGVYFNHYFDYATQNDEPIVIGSISMASDQSKDYIKFKGLYYDGQKIQKISGAALLMFGQFVPNSGYIVCIQLLDDTVYPVNMHSMFRAVWSVTGAQDIPAAQVFRWNVEIKTP